MPRNIRSVSVDKLCGKLGEMRNEADLYKRVVYWSDEDQCFIGMCPELIYGGVHGENALAVFIELNQAIEEAIEILKQEGKPLPAPKSLQFEAV